MTSDSFTAEAWRARGFVGFELLSTLQPTRVPNRGGTYAVLRTCADPPLFNRISTGGHFKAKDPTVDVAVLAAKWVDGAETVYIGKATNLRSRLRQFRDFGAGRPIGHWGGRYIWQLCDAAELLVCWQVTATDPREAERSLVADFVSVTGKRPFANLVA